MTNAYSLPKNRLDAYSFDECFTRSACIHSRYLFKILVFKSRCHLEDSTFDETQKKIFTNELSRPHYLSSCIWGQCFINSVLSV